MLSLAWPKQKFVLNLVKKYKLFDADWYCAVHPELRLSCGQAYAHYRSRGLACGFSPTPLFQPRRYLDHNPDVAEAGIDPLYHYLRHGGREDRLGAHFLISPGWIRRQVDLETAEHHNPLLALRTAKSWIDPRRMVDTRYLAEQTGAATTWDALRLYAGSAEPDSLFPHLLFDPAAVCASVQVPRDQSALEYYIGTKGLHSVHPHLLINSDVIYPSGALHFPLDKGTTFLEDLMALGTKFRDPTCTLFDSRYYLSQAGDAVPEGCLALEHFLRGGWKEGYWPNYWFDPVAYAARYMKSTPDDNPLVHYAKNGREQHIDLVPRFSQKYYIAQCPEVLTSYRHTPLEHYIKHGMSENRPAMPGARWSDDFITWSELRGSVRVGFSGSFSGSPEVSVIVPVYNQFHYTLRCVWSILQAGDAARVEVIVADDGSTDETQAFFSALPGLRYVRHSQNLGFVRSCNRAAGRATAPVLYFLNNDTAVLPGWIDTILATLETHPAAGLVGSKLIYPNGLLQEAGGYIWRDGGGANVGRNGDPDEPGYNYLRDVDYASGAGIAVRHAAWDAVGGFDERYAPAYCEDTDLAMALRQHGWRVLYQPGSEVVHFEGVSSGTDTSTGVKAYQVVNFEKLRDKWRYALETHARDHRQDPRALVRPRRPRICVIEARVPTPDKDAGSVILMGYLQALLGLGYEIAFVPENLALDGAYGRALQAMGIEVLHRPYVASVEAYLRAHGAAFDCFFLSRVDAGGRFNPLIRSLWPDTPVIFSTVDLHYLRQERQARLLETGVAAALAQAKATKGRELALIRNTSVTLVMSEHERQILAREGLGGALAVVPLVLEARAAADVPPRAGRRGIAFVGGYEHAPNVDAVLWFCEHVWPGLHAAMPELTFHIAGSKAPPEITELDIPGVVVEGFVSDLDAFLDARIATIAPLRFGAGIKGKVGSSLAAGVPCISSPIGVEGMGLNHGENVLVAGEPQEFIDAVLGLIGDESAWQSLSEAGLGFVDATYSLTVTRRRFLRLMARINAAPFSGTCPISGATEIRRFLEADQPDSLAADSDGPWSSERVLAAALLKRLGQGETTLGQLRAAPGTGVAVSGRLPALETALRARGLHAGPAAAQLHVARIVLDARAPAALASLLKFARAEELLIACAAPETADLANAGNDPDALCALTTQLLRAGPWDVRTTLMPLPESAITKTTLIEAKIRTGQTETADL